MPPVFAFFFAGFAPAFAFALAAAGVFSLQRYQHIVLRMIAKISRFAKLLISLCTSELQLFIV